MTQYYAVHLFPLTYIKLYFTGSARVTRAAAILIGSYFLDAPFMSLHVGSSVC